MRDNEDTLPGARPAPLPAQPAPEFLCSAGELAERGKAYVWSVLLWGRRAKAFALRYDGRTVAYINRCAHVPTEMDWSPGEFLDIERRFILCSIHGAAYEPRDGRCIGGPCGQGRLMPVTVREADGEVYWYPSRDIQPLPRDEPGAEPAPPAAAAP
jgi:nitrite reductase/ring-hydroxylating ferredoxin subunit